MISRSIKSVRLTLAILLAFFVFVVGSLFFISPSKLKSASAAGEIVVEENTIEVPLSMFPASANVAGTTAYYHIAETIYITQRFVLDYSYELEPFRSGSLIISSSSNGELFSFVYANPMALYDHEVDQSLSTTVSAEGTAVSGSVVSCPVLMKFHGTGLGWAYRYNIGLTDNKIVITGVTDQSISFGNFSLTIQFVSSLYTFLTVPNLYTATNPFVIYSPFTQNGAFDQGYDYGFDQGYKNGMQESFQDGYNKGYSDGNLEGFQDGHDEGYNVGLAVGKNSVSGNTLATSVKSFVFSLFDAPVSTFMDVFNFDYDGFNIGALVAFIFSIAIVAGVLKVIL